MAASMKMYEDGCLLGCCTMLTAFIALMMEGAITSETSVNFYQTAWCNNPENSHLHENNSSSCYFK
jgi:hypothetical protein